MKVRTSTSDAPVHTSFSPRGSCPPGPCTPPRHQTHQCTPLPASAAQPQSQAYSRTKYIFKPTFVNPESEIILPDAGPDGMLVLFTPGSGSAATHRSSPRHLSCHLLYLSLSLRSFPPSGIILCKNCFRDCTVASSYAYKELYAQHDLLETLFGVYICVPIRYVGKEAGETAYRYAESTK